MIYGVKMKLINKAEIDKVSSLLKQLEKIRTLESDILDDKHDIIESYRVVVLQHAVWLDKQTLLSSLENRRMFIYEELSKMGYEYQSED